MKDVLERRIKAHESYLGHMRALLNNKFVCKASVWKDIIILEAELLALYGLRKTFTTEVSDG